MINDVVKKYSYYVLRVAAELVMGTWVLAPATNFERMQNGSNATVSDVPAGQGTETACYTSGY